MDNLLAIAMEAHGGLENWKKVSLINVDLEIGGNILLTKCRSPFNRHYSCTIDPNNIEVILDPFPKKGFRGIYQGDNVHIHRGDGKEVKRKKIDRTLLTCQFAWDDLDLLYFFGYAIWNYILTPFLLRLPGFSVQEHDPLKQKNGTIVRRLKAVFPETVPTHCTEQTFYFDEQGLLIRLDYTADIFGSWAKGAHLCSQHRKFDTFIFPTKRKVHAAWFAGYPLPFLTAMQGTVNDVHISY